MSRPSALVLGGGGGIGAAVSRRLAAEHAVAIGSAKAGLEAATRVAAKELAGRGITVNAVRPGATDTETLRKGTPEDVAGAVMMLCSPDAAWVTGTVLDATGGLR